MCLPMIRAGPGVADYLEKEFTMSCDVWKFKNSRAFSHAKKSPKKSLSISSNYSPGREEFDEILSLIVRLLKLYSSELFNT